MSTRMFDTPAASPAPARAPRDPAATGYEGFGNVPRRNWLQSRVEVPAMIRALSLPRAARILEVGCGRGIALEPIWRICRPTRLAALDIERDFLLEAEDALAASDVRAELFHGDVRRMPFPDGVFDVVIDFGTCYHIRGADRALAEIARVLAPGGLFVHETPVSQALAHPVRSFGRRIPFAAEPAMRPHRNALLWATRRKD